jgi:hypothetical protein
MPEAAVSPLSIAGILWETLRLFLQHWKRHLILSFLCALPMAVLLGLGFFQPIAESMRLIVDAERSAGGPVAQVRLPPDAMLRLFSSMALTLLMMSAYATAWWLGLFSLRREGMALLEAYAATLSRFIVFGIILLCLMTTASFVGSSLLGPLVGLVGDGVAFLTLLIVAVFLGFAMRLGLALPATAWGESISFGKAWTASQGLTFRLGAVTVLLLLLALFVSLILQGLLTAGDMLATGWGAGLAVFLMSPVNFLLYALPFSALAAVFAELRQGKKL